MKLTPSYQVSKIYGLNDIPEFVEAVKYRAVPVGADIKVGETLGEALSTKKI